jgi:hypothetical protein
MAADIDLQDAQVAIGDANLLIKAADDMDQDLRTMMTRTQHTLDAAAGDAKDACQASFDAYCAAFRDLAATYRSLGQATVQVLRDTLDADQEAKLIWSRQSAQRNAVN